MTSRRGHPDHRKPTKQDLDEASEPLPSEEPLDAKLSHLGTGLELSDLLDEIALLDIPDSNSDLRLATAFALKSVIGFLQSTGLSSLTLKRLLSILGELDEGHVHPLVTPTSVPHRKPDSVSVQKNKALAAAAMHLFMDDPDMSKDQCAARVARALARTLFSKYGGKPITAGMIATWRDRYAAHSDEGDAFAAEIFQMAVTAARGKFSTPRRQAEGVLKTIAQVAKI